MKFLFTVFATLLLVGGGQPAEEATGAVEEAVIEVPEGVEVIEALEVAGEGAAGEVVDSPEETAESTDEEAADAEDDTSEENPAEGESEGE